MPLGHSSGPGSKAGTGSSNQRTLSGLGISKSLFSSGASSYLANVSSRSLVPNLYIAPATASWANFRKVDYARANVSGNVRALVANYRYNAATEVGPSASARVRVSIEYPIGSTPQRFQFASFSGDVYNGIVGNNAQVETLDLSLNVPIPAGAKFLWHTQFECTGGVAVNQTTAYLAEDGFEFGTASIPDRTQTGGTAYGSPSTGNTYGPLALIATTNSASVAGHGDSNQLGAIGLVSTQFAASDQNGYQGLCGRSIAPSLPYMNLGSYGDTIQAFITAQGAKRRAQMAYSSHIITDIGINDIRVNNRTAAQVYADLQTLRGMFPTKKFYACTLAPCTTGAWANADGSDQVLTAQEAERAAFNALLIANSAGFDGIFQTDVAVALAGRTKWIANYTAEGTHYLQVAQLAVKDSGIIQPSVFTR